jgi:hypothetical protein
MAKKQTHHVFSTPKRVQIMTGSGADYFKRGQYGYVLASNTHGGMYFVDKPGSSKKGELAYLVSKTKGMRGGALWFSADGLRFTSR